ncbi:NAD(P)/FAD-dependent oxidoreductase [Gulosibacter molinativorax]|uniref:FAD-dependent oxidoreductase n=1 Tax=Gulosibacter molinativorax TaxID=256821 RepID=A0ABT7C7I8_9MICO|nr:FAD-dependent oxidoreductase [Gulosibacter molinativorax]MDJ1371171.1 FAD-dependent oxidoreductase [Gulosibacter molinativorax]QUY62987.1 Gamma-glutamylputrescine oxidoreductase [Gulosibacter molinativorax]
MINGNVSHWWTQIGLPTPRPALAESIDVDVAIVGGGYTGMWTAYYLKQARPDLRVAILEARFCGFGASGRNGGWLTNTVTGGLSQYERSHGHEAGERFQLAMNATVDEVIAFAKREGIDADIVKGGELEVAYTPAQLARLDEWFAAEAKWRGTDWMRLSADEAKSRVNVAGVLGGMWHPHCARIHPAKLAAGLARVVDELGVEIYENTRATEIRPHEAITDRGTVRAGTVVRATEGFTSGLKGLHREWLPMNSSMIVTEPLSDAQWDVIGWEGRDTLADMAHVYMYAQRTADDRIAFGGRGVPYRWNSRTDIDGFTQPVTAGALQDLLVRFFPVLHGIDIDHLWSGTLGVPRDWAASVGYDAATGLAHAGGYVGTGVSTTNLAGRTLRDLILGEETELASLPWVGHRVRKWEPEPLRWFATRVIYGAYGAADRAEYRGLPTTSGLAKVADAVAGRGH